MPGNFNFSKIEDQKNFAIKKAKIKLYTVPSYWGAEVDESVTEGLPIVELPLNKLVGFEPDEKMESTESGIKAQQMSEQIKQGKDKLTPILVRIYKDRYQIIDGHHRFHASKIAGEKTISAIIVPDEEIEVINKI